MMLDASENRDDLRRLILGEGVTLRDVERQIGVTRTSLLHQLDTLEATIAQTDAADGRELRHLATVVEHTARLMHETIELLQVRRVLAQARDTVTLRVTGFDIRLT